MGGSAFRFGERAIWWAIASLMIGLLIACRTLPSGTLKGADWAEGAGRNRSAPTISGSWPQWETRFPLLINVCWHFLINWLPTYLKEDRGMTYLASGMWSRIAVPGGGFREPGEGCPFSRFLVGSRGWSPFGLEECVLPSWRLARCSLRRGHFVGWVGDNQSRDRPAGFHGVRDRCYGSWRITLWCAFARSVSSNRHTGFVVGVLGGLGNLCVAGFLPFAGYGQGRLRLLRPDFRAGGRLLPFVGLGALVIGWGAESRRKSKWNRRSEFG